jgi:hypothetical protein
MYSSRWENPHHGPLQPLIFSNETKW